MPTDWLDPALAGTLIGALFVLPYLLFSATGGQLADKLDKARLIRWVKASELLIMALAAWGWIAGNVPTLLACVLLMGLHSTVFGPVKYAWLPQHLDHRELIGGNGLVVAGTFVAIVVGNGVGGLLIAIPGTGRVWVALACLVVAALGVLSAWRIAPSPAADPGLAMDWNPFAETARNLALARRDRTLFRSLLGISWMWFFGAILLALYPALAQDVLRGDETVASLLLMVFAIGIGTGALLCEVLSRRQVEIGLVPLGAIGMTVFALDLGIACTGVASAGTERWTLTAFLAQPGHARVLVDLMLLALSMGLYSVPIYALVQWRVAPTHRARIIAANNVLNALFMLGSAGFVATMLAAGASAITIVMATALLNLAVAVYVFFLVPEYLLRFIAWVAARLVYRIRRRGEDGIPASGPAVIASNHVSLVDAVLLMAACPRPIRFIMDHRIFATPVLGAVFRLAGAIPVAPRSEDPQTYRRAFEAADRALADGELVAIFPEGGLTADGRLQPFRSGIMKILGRRPVPVVPVALSNLWGSFFSKIEGGRAMRRPFRRGLFNRVGLDIGEPMAPDSVTPERLHARVAALLADAAAS